jgi:hypothetical protein
MSGVAAFSIAVGVSRALYSGPLNAACSPQALLQGQLSQAPATRKRSRNRWPFENFYRYRGRENNRREIPALLAVQSKRCSRDRRVNIVIGILGEFVRQRVAVRSFFAEFFE